jgi:acetylornithine deacetylase
LVQSLDRTLEILSTLVAFDTTSRNSNLALIDWTERYLRSYGFVTERFPDATGTKASLLASIGPAGPAGYMLSGHTDVVPVDGQAWSADPFSLRVADGRAYGRGACDMKGFVAACLAAVPAMAAAPLRRPIHIALTHDEEVGCIGARRLCDILARRGWRAAGCFVGEPTGMGVVIGHKGKRNVRVTVRGHGCHSSLAPMGVNAVEWGARLVAEIRRVSEELAATGARDEAYDVPHSTGHVGVFSGGTALNLVPDQAELLFEFRTLPHDDPDALVGAVERFARETLEPQMRQVDPAAGFDFDVYAGSPGLDMAPEDDLVVLAKGLAGRNDHGKVAFMTEAGLFQQLAGIPTVVVGPGSIDQAHQPDEWIALSELERCLGFLQGLLGHCR